MAFTLHWSNHTVDLWRGQDSGQLSVPGAKKKPERNDRYKRKTPLDYNEKIGCLTPVLSITSDILYPNAVASAMGSGDTEERLEVGCKGHQIDEEFPLKSRVPSCVPLVQYPTAVNEEGSWEEQDICALPVLNWENYVYTFKQSSFLSKVRQGGKSSKQQDESGCDFSTEESEVENSPGKKGSNRGGTKSPKLFKRRSQAGYESLPSENEQTNPESDGEQLEFSTSKSKRIESLVTLRKYTNIPDVKVEGTWNYNYHHTGACDWTQDASDKTKRILLVGKGRYLRAVKLGPSKPSSGIGLSVEEVWDEEKEKYHSSNTFGSGESFDNVVFQVTAHAEESIAVVRRGVTIDLYSTLDLPRHLTSIPVCGYKNKVYHKGDNLTSKVGFISCDINQYAPYTVASLDANYNIQIHDVVDESSSAEIRCAVPDSSVLKASKTPKFPINRAAGLLYASDHHALYYYYDSSVFFFDTRQNNMIMEEHQSRQFHPLIDLKCDSSAKAISDQRYFSVDSTNRLHEYISCVQRSHRPNYYYVGTTDRIFLMDWRVPRNPVIKINHGMKSAAAYISTNYNKNFEVLVAGSQRSPEIFSAVLDYGHVSCKNRPGCTALNPILSSYPRHLSNPGDFINLAEEDGIQFVWEEEQRRCRQHCNSWCTGLTIGSLPFPRECNSYNRPRGSFIVSTNNFGDIFYQEWVRKPIPSHRVTQRHDLRWKDFLNNWHDSMKSKKIEESLKPSKNPKLPEDCSLLIEPSFIALENLHTVREKQFDSLEVDSVQYHETLENIQPLEALCEKLKNYKGAKISQFVDVWENDWKSKSSIGIIHPVGTLFENTTDTGPYIPQSQVHEAIGQEPSESIFDQEVTAAANLVSVEIKEEVEDPEYYYQGVDASEVEMICSVTGNERGTETVVVDDNPSQESESFLSGANKYDLPKTNSFSMFDFEDSQPQHENNYSAFDTFSQHFSSQGSYFTEEHSQNTLSFDSNRSWNIPSATSQSQNKNSQTTSYPIVKKRAGF
ncbi:unnamed protein product [Allacma fusca]|uniref:Uncharacterized protein n=1 Tax=Allacma fusca TaxID=39272 RepID=A0A8J2LQ39_9HEXA|nr:unnamed protein product [Allacma fusca]